MYTVRMRDPRWDARDRYMSGVVREYNDYTGDVSDAPPYLNDEWFTLTEESGNVRILFKDNVICSWHATGGSISNPEHYSVRIIRDKKHYTVSLSPRGSFICNCTSFSFRRRCSHIQEVEEIDVGSY